MVRLVAKVGNGRVPLGGARDSRGRSCMPAGPIVGYAAGSTTRARLPVPCGCAASPPPPPLHCRPHPHPPSASSSQVKIEHTDLGGSFVKPQSAKDAEVALEQCERGGAVVLTVGLKPRPVRPVHAPAHDCQLLA